MNIRKSNGLIIHLIRGLAVKKKISPACDHCYAEAWSKQLVLFDGKIIRVAGQRKAIGKKLPIKWNARAFKREHGHWPRVFCASLADLLDNQVPLEWRGDLFALISRMSST